MHSFSRKHTHTLTHTDVHPSGIQHCCHFRRPIPSIHPSINHDDSPGRSQVVKQHRGTDRRTDTHTYMHIHSHARERGGGMVIRRARAADCANLARIRILLHPNEPARRSQLTPTYLFRIPLPTLPSLSPLHPSTHTHTHTHALGAACETAAAAGTLPYSGRTALGRGGGGATW